MYILSFPTLLKPNLETPTRSHAQLSGVCAISYKSFAHLGFLLQINLFLSSDVLQLCCQPFLEHMPVMSVDPPSVYEVISTDALM